MSEISLSCITGTCFIQKIYALSSSLLQGKHLPFTPSPLRLNIFRLFVILSLTQLYRYTPEIFLLSTATFKYKYQAPLRRIGQEYSTKVAFSIFQSLKRIQLFTWLMLFDYSCLPISTNLDYALLSYPTALRILSNIRGLTDDGVMRMKTKAGGKIIYKLIINPLQF